MRIGTLLGRWLCGESTPDEDFALRYHVLTDVELQAEEAWKAFTHNRSPAARQIRGLLVRESWPEVSALFMPTDPEDGSPLAPCKIRIDLVGRPFGSCVAVQIKTTELPLREFWPRMWRKRYGVSASFYREGARHLFGQYVEEYLIVQRTIPPYEVGIFHLSPAEATHPGEPTVGELQRTWLRQCVPALRELRGLATGEQVWSREEMGI